MKRIIATFAFLFFIVAPADAQLIRKEMVESAILDSSAVYCSDVGTTDAYACNLSPALTAYVTGGHYRFRANTANTGSASINFNSLGARTIKKAVGGVTTDLGDNDIRAGQIVDVVYDGSNMQLQSTLGTLPSGTGLGDIVGPSSATDNAIARFDLATGKLIQNSICTISDTGTLTCGDITTNSWTTNLIDLSGHRQTYIPGTANSVAVVPKDCNALVAGDVVKAISALGVVDCMTPAGGAGGAPAAGQYITRQAEAGLSAEFSLGTLSSGILKHTVAASVSTPAVATSADVIGLWTGTCNASSVLAGGGACTASAAVYNGKTVDPTTTDNTSLGYNSGDIWINTTATPDKVWIKTSESGGVASWIQLG